MRCDIHAETSRQEETMKRVPSILVLFLAVTFFSARPSFAQMGQMEMMGGGEKGHPGGMPGMGPGMGMPKGNPHGDPFSPEVLREYLGLNDDQVQKMRQLRMEYEKESIRKHADLRVAQLELADLLQQKNIDMGQVEKKIRQIETVRGDLMLFRIRSLMKAKDFLNDEQFARFKQMTLAFSAHRMVRGMMRGMPPPGMMGPGMGETTPETPQGEEEPEGGE
jgi:hypothetical protein